MTTSPTGPTLSATSGRAPVGGRARQVPAPHLHQRVPPHQRRLRPAQGCHGQGRRTRQEASQRAHRREAPRQSAGPDASTDMATKHQGGGCSPRTLRRSESPMCRRTISSKASSTWHGARRRPPAASSYMAMTCSTTSGSVSEQCGTFLATKHGVIFWYHLAMSLGGRRRSGILPEEPTRCSSSCGSCCLSGGGQYMSTTLMASTTTSWASRRRSPYSPSRTCSKAQPPPSTRYTGSDVSPRRHPQPDRARRRRKSRRFWRRSDEPVTR